MNRNHLGTRRVWERGLTLAFFAAVTLPTLAWAQIDSTASSHTSQTTTTTTTTAPFVSDWRLWAAVGAILVVILIIAVSRGGKGSGDTTTVIK